MNNSRQASETTVGPHQGLREDRVLQALRFLADPRTRSASQQEKEQFLRQKGITETEIAAAFSRANPSTISSLQTSPLNDPTAASRPLFIPPPILQEPVLWSAIKSIFTAVGAIAIGVLGYHMYLEGNRKKDYDSTECDDAKLFHSHEKNAHSSCLVDEDRLTEAIKKLQTEQELRHKELLLSIRELSSAINSSSDSARKPGGSVVLKDDEETAGKSFPIDARVESDEPIDIPAEVTGLIEKGLESTIQLIFSNFPPHKKLNKSNAKFKKLEGSLLLKKCGYVENSDFFEYSENQPGSRDSISQILAEIKTQKSNAGKSQNLLAASKADGSLLQSSLNQNALPRWLEKTSESQSLLESGKYNQTSLDKNSDES